ncbi:Zn-finger in ubiquitin-hydrolase [Apiospora kogelbergensis]|uniref:Zn-finger in ubiquitin-hydrolase n=1 Tax=Apiospora kogelbergensis TaxID=1337665 RepID=A0AAW0R1K5_9PEZI
MPSYYYHLRFELYSTPTPQSRSEAKGKSNIPIWLPPKHFDIFGELPAHTQEATPHNRIHRQLPSASAAQPSGNYKSEPDCGLIDCGTPRPTASEVEPNRVLLNERQYRQLHQRTASFPPPPSYAAIKPQTAARDWRFNQLSVHGLDMATPTESASKAMAAANSSSTSSTAAAIVGPYMGSTGKATKARFLPLKTKNTSIGWGIVHLYREVEETPELAALAGAEEVGDPERFEGVDCTTLCIPAVPSYLSPSDFLGFVGEKWKDQVSHYRMVMTGRLNRYLVLLKFRDSKRAYMFKREFDGKVFNDIEPETCTIAFIRSITFETPTRSNESFPDLSQDPFTPSIPSGATESLRPFPPPTPNLIELPTCPVCLERMDDTTGLLTIPCQHVFHCSCLQKWRGTGCPVCRHTNPSLAIPNDANGGSSSSTAAHGDVGNPFAQPFGSHVSNLCAVCDSPDDLWICLICGNVGCGRYKGGHAKEHWKDTAHTFALELDTQHVWDYAGDIWVHRLIREKGEGKVVELPGHHDQPREQQDVVPRAKLDSIGIEYTHLLTSQLESQRVYFEEMLSKAADKAAKASADAEAAAAQATEALKELRSLKAEHQVFTSDTLPNLEKDIARERVRATKSTDLARNLSKSLQEEKLVNEGLMKRLEHVSKEMENLGEQVKGLQVENADLKDQNHDLSMFISGQEKLKEMEAEGAVEQEELEAGSASVPESKRKKGKGRAKG